MAIISEKNGSSEDAYQISTLIGFVVFIHRNWEEEFHTLYWLANKGVNN